MTRRHQRRSAVTGSACSHDSPNLLTGPSTVTTCSPNLLTPINIHNMVLCRLQTPEPYLSVWFSEGTLVCRVSARPTDTPFGPEQFYTMRQIMPYATNYVAQYKITLGRWVGQRLPQTGFSVVPLLLGWGGRVCCLRAGHLFAGAPRLISSTAAMKCCRSEMAAITFSVIPTELVVIHISGILQPGGEYGCLCINCIKCDGCRQH